METFNRRSKSFDPRSTGIYVLEFSCATVVAVGFFLGLMDIWNYLRSIDAVDVIAQEVARAYVSVHASDQRYRSQAWRIEQATQAGQSAIAELLPSAHYGCQAQPNCVLITLTPSNPLDQVQLVQVDVNYTLPFMILVGHNSPIKTRVKRRIETGYIPRDTACIESDPNLDHGARPDRRCTNF